MARPSLLLPPAAAMPLDAEFTRGEVIWAPTAVAAAAAARALAQPAGLSGASGAVNGGKEQLGLFIVVYGLVRSSFTGGHGLHAAQRAVPHSSQLVQGCAGTGAAQTG